MVARASSTTTRPRTSISLAWLAAQVAHGELTIQFVGNQYILSGGGLSRQFTGRTIVACFEAAMSAYPMSALRANAPSPTSAPSATVKTRPTKAKSAGKAARTRG